LFIEDLFDQEIEAINTGLGAASCGHKVITHSGEANLNQAVNKICSRLSEPDAANDWQPLKLFQQSLIGSLKTNLHLNSTTFEYLEKDQIETLKKETFLVNF
jgi:hypothetical protein